MDCAENPRYTKFEYTEHPFLLARAERGGGFGPLCFIAVFYRYTAALRAAVFSFLHTCLYIYSAHVEKKKEKTKVTKGQVTWSLTSSDLTSEV